MFFLHTFTPRVGEINFLRKERERKKFVENFNRNDVFRELKLAEVHVRKQVCSNLETISTTL